MIEDDLRHPLEPDSSEQAVDLADDEALAGIDDVIRREIRDTQAALQRMKNGTYGICTSCGKRIDAARLDAVPTASHCMECS
jgi:RNA polymerase-binding transcription factor DksA